MYAMANTENINLRLPPELLARIREEAVRERRSTASIIRAACTAYLDAQDVLAGRGKESK